MISRRNVLGVDVISKVYQLLYFRKSTHFIVKSNTKIASAAYVFTYIIMCMYAGMLGFSPMFRLTFFFINNA